MLIRSLRAAVPAAALVAAALLAPVGSAAAMPMSEDVVLPTRLDGINRPGKPTVMVVGDSIPKEMEDTFSSQLKDRRLNLLKAAFGGCSVTGLYQLNDTSHRPFTWSTRCTKVPAVQTQAVTQYKPQLVIWFSGREKFSFCTTPSSSGCSKPDNLYQAGTSRHHVRQSASIQASFKRLTDKGAKLVIVLPTPRGATPTGPCAANPAATGCAQDPVDLTSVAWMKRAYTALATKYPGRVAVVAMDDLICPDFDAVTGCPATMRQGVLIRNDGVHIAASQEKWFVSNLLTRIGALPGNFLPTP